MKKVVVFGVFTFVILALAQCEKDKYVSPSSADSIEPTPYYLKVPQGFPDYFLEQQNALTNEGVELGRKLFFDPILSKNRDVSCASCHLQFTAFAHVDHKISHGIEGRIGKRNAPGLANLAWRKLFHWDGGVLNLNLEVSNF